MGFYGKGMRISKDEVIDEFLHVFKPYRARFIQKDDEDSEVVTINGRLSDGMIWKGLVGEVIVGWYMACMTPMFGVDVDDHIGIAWKDDKPSESLRSTLDEVVKRVGKVPSVIFKSKRGVHCYWCMNKELPALLIEKLIKNKLSDLTVELLPLPNQALRIPRIDWCLDVESLEIKKFEGFKGRKYEPTELFGDDWRAETIRENVRKNKKFGLSYVRGGELSDRKRRKIEEVERGVGGFKNGETNETYKRLCGMYFGYGLSEEEAFKRFRNIVQKSHGYTGGLTNVEELGRRIRSTYRCLADKKDGVRSKDEEVRLEEGIDGLIDGLIDGGEWRKRREKKVRRFMSELIGWKEYIDEIRLDTVKLVYWNYIYPFSYKFFKEGLYPLPSEMMRSWDYMYPEIIDFLKREGVLRESQHRYSTGAGYCKHYFINVTRVYKLIAKLSFVGRLLVKANN
ncbi:MAG: hypothetical protein KJI72_04015 [Patescibacteria group bacterium]|nr:hypothetical protein [Patescibacteria group bacterium]